MPQFWKIDTDHKLAEFTDFAKERLEADKPVLVKLMGEDSTDHQRAMLWALYRDLGEKTGAGVVEVRRFIKLHYAVPILRANDLEFCAFYDKALKKLPYETKLELMDYLEVTSRPEFTKTMASELISTIIREYAKQGILIDQPESKSLSYL